MIVKLPTFAKDWDDEYMKLFAAFMYLIGDKYGFNGYVVHPHDIRIICQRFMREPNTQFPCAPVYYHFGKFNRYNWIWDWLKRPKTIDYEFTNERTHLIWGYIMGRLAENDLLNENPGKWNKTNDYILTEQEQEQFRFRGKDII